MSFLSLPFLHARRPPPPIAAAATRGRVHSHAGLGSQDRFGVNARADAGFVAIAVCDGHGRHGAEVAEGAAAALMRAAEDQARGGAEAGVAAREAMRAAAARVEEMAGAQTSGTTAVVAVLDRARRRVAVASVGDCEAVLVRSGGSGVKRSRPTIDLLTVAHRTYDKGERARVEAAGGRVQAGYVIVSEVESVESGGSKYVKSLNITRSLGDLDMRQYGIISEPHVVEMDVPSEDSMLILATDGLWGSGDDDDIPPHLWFGEAIAKYIKTPNVVVRRLFQMIGKPEDDATVVCMRMDV